MNAGLLTREQPVSVIQNAQRAEQVFVSDPITAGGCLEYEPTSYWTVLNSL